MTLKELRVQSGKTAAEVAKELGVSIRAMSHYECGTRSVGLQQVLTLAEIYECTAEEIIRAQLLSIGIYETKKIVG